MFMENKKVVVICFHFSIFEPLETTGDAISNPAFML